jgi:hypothetical protein
MQSTRHRLLVGVTTGVLATLLLVLSVSKNIQNYSNIDNVLVGQAAESIVQPAKMKASESQLYADASSPLYLEPYRHEETDNIAWKWAADVRSRKPAKNTPNPRATVSESTAIDATVKLAQLDAATVTPCPWYGCADGSHADFSQHAITPPAHEKALASHESAKAVKLKAKSSNKANVKKQSAKGHDATPQGVKKHQKLLAHGYGTSDTFTSKPLSAEKNQFYGGSSEFYGSNRPVTSRAGFVSGSQAYSVDMAPAYDLDDATSFDSLPLASPSSPESRIALAQPAGDGTLAQNLFRYPSHGYSWKLASQVRLLD